MRKVSIMMRFNEKYMPVTESGCWLWLGACGRNGRARMYHNGRNSYASHVAWELFKGCIPMNAFLCHHCDVPGCVNPDHLYIGDVHTNSADMMRRHRNRVPVGVRHWKCKLQDSEVKDIRALTQAGKTSSEIGQIYGVAGSTILKIKNGETWKHVA